MLCILILTLLFFGCGNSKGFTSSRTSETPFSTLTAHETPSSDLTATVISAQKSRLTKNPPTSPPGLLATWTPLPTLSRVQAQKAVMDLYENSSCKLPCWWGIVPGRTGWREAWQFLGQFATNSSPWETLLLESKDLPGHMFYRVYLDVPQTPELNRYSALNDLLVLVQMNTFTVENIDVNTGNIKDYTIPKILSDYGKPKQVYAIGFPTPVSWNSGVALYLYYPQYGFISSHFTTVDAESWAKPTFTACFQKTSKLFLWPEGKQLEFFDRLKESLFDPETISAFTTLDEVTDLSVDKFYKIFAGSQEPACVEFESIIKQGQ